jgi:hypothetical protein
LCVIIILITSLDKLDKYSTYQKNLHKSLCFQTNAHPTVTVTQPQSSYPGLTPTSDTDGSIKIERLPVVNASKCFFD